MNHERRNAVEEVPERIAAPWPGIEGAGVGAGVEAGVRARVDGGPGVEARFALDRELLTLATVDPRAGIGSKVGGVIMSGISGGAPQLAPRRTSELPRPKSASRAAPLACGDIRRSSVLSPRTKR